jgi:hypothetical protein
MKKFIITTAIFMVLPIVSLAAFQTPASQTPVQPMPENTAPNLSGNANTPGNEYNQSQQQTLEQIGETRAPDENAQTPQASIPGSSLAAKADLYTIFIVVSALVLLGLFGWVIYRYRLKKD